MVGYGFLSAVFTTSFSAGFVLPDEDVAVLLQAKEMNRQKINSGLKGINSYF
jgi:hypothetical protein